MLLLVASWFCPCLALPAAVAMPAPRLCLSLLIASAAGWCWRPACRPSGALFPLASAALTARLAGPLLLLQGGAGGLPACTEKPRRAVLRRGSRVHQISAAGSTRRSGSTPSRGSSKRGRPTFGSGSSGGGGGGRRPAAGSSGGDGLRSRRRSSWRRGVGRAAAVGGAGAGGAAAQGPGLGSLARRKVVQR